MFNPLGLIEGSGQVFNTSDIPSPEAMRETKHSFFVETLSFLSELNTEYYESNRLFYRSMLEGTVSSEPSTVVHESFGDFFDSIKRIIDKFLGFIKSLFERFITLFNRMIGRDKYILKHKKDLEKFSTIHEFTITGFRYDFNEAIPVIEPLAEFNSDFVFNLASSDNTVSVTVSNKNDLKSANRNLTNNLSDGSWYDNFRGKVIGKSDTAISRDDFAEALFAEFRDGQTISDEIDVDKSYVMEAFNRFENHKSTIDKVKRLKNEIDSKYNAIKKSVENMVKVNRAGNAVTGRFDDRLGQSTVTLTSDDLASIDNFAKTKATQVQEMANIHALAFAAKLDALTDCYKQDKAVLFKALSRVQSNKKEEY